MSLDPKTVRLLRRTRAALYRVWEEAHYEICPRGPMKKSGEPCSPRCVYPAPPEIQEIDAALDPDREGRS